MKKTLLTLLAASCLQIGAWAQTYNFTKSTGTYTDLTGATVVSTAGWDEDTYDAPIGFQFTIGNMTTDSVHFDSYGDINFISPTDLKLVVGYEADLMDRGNSPISYQLSGTAGSRIFKIEFKNAGFWSTSGPIAGEFANFQVWLYEGSNKIEMHYGANNVVNGLNNFMSGTGSSHGIVSNINSTNGDATGPFLTGSPANPVVSNSVIPFDLNSQYWNWPSLTGVPADGTIYTFAVSGPTGVAKDLKDARISVYPNPVTEILTIEGLTATTGNATVKIYDVLGKIVFTQESAVSNTIPVNVSKLNQGTYFVEITTEAGRTGKHIIKH